MKHATISLWWPRPASPPGTARTAWGGPGRQRAAAGREKPAQGGSRSPGSRANSFWLPGGGLALLVTGPRLSGQGEPRVRLREVGACGGRWERLRVLAPGRRAEGAPSLVPGRKRQPTGVWRAPGRGREGISAPHAAASRACPSDTAGPALGAAWAPAHSGGLRQSPPVPLPGPRPAPALGKSASPADAGPARVRPALLPEPRAAAAQVRRHSRRGPACGRGPVPATRHALDRGRRANAPADGGLYVNPAVPRRPR